MARYPNAIPSACTCALPQTASTNAEGRFGLSTSLSKVADEIRLGFPPPNPLCCRIFPPLSWFLAQKSAYSTDSFRRAPLFLHTFNLLHLFGDLCENFLLRSKAQPCLPFNSGPLIYHPVTLTKRFVPCSDPRLCYGTFFPSAFLYSRFSANPLLLLIFNGCFELRTNLDTRDGDFLFFYLSRDDSVDSPSPPGVVSAGGSFLVRF